jgi:hypothetical protein
LAEIFCVSRATIRRDAEVTAAVVKITAQCGEDVKPLLLSRESRLSRGGVLALAAKPVAEQRALVAELRRRGRLPRGWRGGSGPATITLPREPEAMADVLVCRFGSAWVEDLCRVLLARCRRKADEAARGNQPPYAPAATAVQ